MSLTFNHELGVYMKTLKLILGLSALSVTAVALSVQLFRSDELDLPEIQTSAASQQLNVPTSSQTIQRINKQLPVKSVTNPSKKTSSYNSQVVTPVYIVGETEVLQEIYEEELVADESWNEEAYIEKQHEIEKTMSDYELAARDQINYFENQLHDAEPTQLLNTEVYSQLEQLFQPTEDGTEELLTETSQPERQLLDIQCSNQVCRIAIETLDEYSQNELLENLPQQLDWVDRTFANVQIQPDDRRVVTLYLTRLEHSVI